MTVGPTSGPGQVPAGPAGTRPSGGAGRRPAPAGARPAGVRPAGVAPPGARPLGVGRDDLQRLTWALATLYLEVESGLRPRAQVERLLAPLLAERLAQVWVRPGPPGVVVAVHGTWTAADRYDAVALVRRGPRVAALAFGLARLGGRWTVVSAGRPEDGELPAPAVPLPPCEPDSFDAVADDARSRRWQSRALFG